MSWIGIGRVAAPHGVRGELRVKIETDFPERFEAGNELTLLSGPQGSPRTYRVLGSREHKGMMLLQLQGVETRDDADKLRGVEIVVPRHEVKPLPEGSYYIFDLIGLDVFDTQGSPLGKLAEVLHPGGNDVYVIRGEREILVAAVKQFIKEVDVSARRMVIDPPEELD